MIVVGDVVSVEVTLVKEQLITQARAPARLNRHPKAQIVSLLLVEQGAGLLCGRVGQADAGSALGRLGGLRAGHCGTPQ